jgi:hypothetical protein
MPFSVRRACSRPGPERLDVSLVIVRSVEVPEPVPSSHLHLYGPSRFDQGEEGIFPGPDGALDERNKPLRVHPEERLKESFRSDGNGYLMTFGPSEERSEELRVDLRDVTSENGARFVAGGLQPGP